MLQKEVSAADSNAIFKSTVSLYGGLIDPETDQMTNVDATQVKILWKYQLWQLNYLELNKLVHIPKLYN